RPRRQDRRREPLPLTGFRVNPLVVHAWCGHLHRTGTGGHVPRLVIAVAHHQPAAVLVTLVDEPGAVGIDLGPQRLGQHPPGTLAHDPIDYKRRPERHHRGRTLTVGIIRVCREHEPYLPDQRCRSGLAWSLNSVTREGTLLPSPIHRFQALL